MIRGGVIHVVVMHGGALRVRTQEGGFVAWFVNRGGVVQIKTVRTWLGCIAIVEDGGLVQFSLLGSVLRLLGPGAAF